MIDRNDFIKAIGQPDKAFEDSVQQALAEVLLSEKRSGTRRPNPLKYMLPAAALVAAAACAVFMLMRPTEQPDKVYGSGVMSQPVESPETTAESTPAPVEQIHAEATETTPEPVEEAYTEAAEITPEPIEEPIEEPYTEAIETTPGPTPYPIPMDNLPEEHWMLTDTLNIDINSLYEGYTYTDTAEYPNKGDVKCWMVSNGEQQVIACTITYGHITMADIDSGEFKAPTLHVSMLQVSEDTERTKAIMTGAAPWLAEIYENSSAMVQGSGEEQPLNSINITFDENNEPKFCEMYFGLNCECYISWMLNEDGSAEIIKIYREPEYVLLDYDDPAEYDTMEVTIPDPVLEAAIRSELNWQGKLTPAKLAELTELTIKNGGHIETLEGLQYCTNLEYLMLPECGIDNDDLKYISALPSLFSLNLAGNNITDITDLSGLDLGWLMISYNNISNLWPLSGMTNLYELQLEGNPLSGEGALKPLAGLSGMRILYLMNCGITDVAPLAELYKNAPMLEIILVNDNPIEDYSPLYDIDIANIYWGEH